MICPNPACGYRLDDRSVAHAEKVRKWAVRQGYDADKVLVCPCCGTALRFVSGLNADGVGDDRLARVTATPDP